MSGIHCLLYPTKAPLKGARTLPLTLSGMAATSSHSSPSKASFASTSPTTLSTSPSPSLSIAAADEDPEATADEARKLTSRARSPWRMCNQGKGVERQFRFKTFKATWDFMNEVAAECKRQRHHPEWTNRFNQTHIRWTTHKPEGLSSKDTHMAAYCDRFGEVFGEVVEEAGGVGSGRDQGCGLVTDKGSHGPRS